ncbi:MAG: MltA domain-containing protein [Candidatus Magnetominusculus sp. LBB02]|nr:MltA domain-containing protein [Candidatus Magnetominusculus sp. LBB02]
MLIKYAVLAALLALVGCASITIEKTSSMHRLSVDQYPELSDDAPLETLTLAMTQNMNYLNALKDGHVFQYGPDTYTAKEIRDSMAYFMSVINAAKGDKTLLNQKLRDEFTVYEAAGSDGLGKVYYTGYYVPLLNGSRTKSVRYPYPLYGLPKDMIKVDLGLFGQTYKGDAIVGRAVGGRLVPYYTNEEICKGALAGNGLELFWVDSRVELFFLQVQGSGTIRLEDGSEINVTYAGSNGHPYRPAGKVLVDENKIPLSEISLRSIKEYLAKHPDDVDRVLFSNPSYVFFRQSKESAIGSTGVPLVDGRAIATDKKIFPQGALVYVSTKKTEFTKDEAVSGQSTLTRFALNQDTGGAIKGPGRADFFWGRGTEAETQAGFMKYNGTLYFIVKKR